MLKYIIIFFLLIGASYVVIMRVDEDITSDIAALIKDFSFSGEKNTVISDTVVSETTGGENIVPESEVTPLTKDQTQESLSDMTTSLGSIRKTLEEKKGEEPGGIQTLGSDSNMIDEKGYREKIEKKNEIIYETKTDSDEKEEIYPTSLSEKDMEQIRSLMGNIE